MDNIEMEKLLVYKNDKIFLCGVDLVSLTNMCFRTRYDFLKLMRIYFRNNVKVYGMNYNAYIINAIERDIHFPSNPKKIDYVVEGEILVDKKVYEECKKMIFDFTYTKCSSLADKPYNRYILKSSSEMDMQDKLLDNYDTYSCFYKTSDRLWNYQISDIKIDKNEQERKYEELNSLIQKVKVLK